jgi:hypothetical protein
MRVAGIQVRDHAVAELAMFLHEAGHSHLAQRIGNAFDTIQRELRLSRRDLPIVAAFGLREYSPLDEAATLVTAAERNRGMLVGGVPIDERLLRELARVVDRNLAQRLDTALLYRAQVLGLTVDERAAILKALENPPPGLEELRSTLLQDPRWRLSERLGQGQTSWDAPA